MCTNLLHHTWPNRIAIELQPEQRNSGDLLCTFYHKFYYLTIMTTNVLLLGWMYFNIYCAHTIQHLDIYELETLKYTITFMFMQIQWERTRTSSSWNSEEPFLSMTKYVRMTLTLIALAFLTVDKSLARQYTPILAAILRLKGVLYFCLYSWFLP